LLTHTLMRLLTPPTSAGGGYPPPYGAPPPQAPYQGMAYQAGPPPPYGEQGWQGYASMWSRPFGGFSCSLSGFPLVGGTS